MSLLDLAPTIQEHILYMTCPADRPDPIRERQLRSVTKLVRARTGSTIPSAMSPASGSRLSQRTVSGGPRSAALALKLYSEQMGRPENMHNSTHDHHKRSSRLGHWLPSDRKLLNAWLAKTTEVAEKKTASFHPVILEFQELIETDPAMLMYFTQMFDQQPSFARRQT